MPSTPALKDINLAIQVATEAINTKVDSILANQATLIAGQGADSAAINAIAAAQVIHEQLLRSGLDHKSLDYKGTFGTDAEIGQIDTDVAAIPTQVTP